MSRVRQWWRAVALTLVASVVCVLLGEWQLDRREQKLARIAEVEANYDAAPVPLTAVLPGTGSPLPVGGDFTPVEVTGTYDAAATVLVRNRPLDGAYGYRVLVPLVLDPASAPAASGGPGDVLVVDRGWVRSGADGSSPGRVPAPPEGQVRVLARLRPPEPADTRDAPAGQVQRIDLAGSVATALGASPGASASGGGVADRLVTGAYAQLAAEDPAPARRLAALPRPAADEGPHLGYSLQWFVFAGGLWAFLVVHVRRAARDDAAAGADGSAGRGGGGPRPPQRPSRRTRRDEDAEDAALDAAEAAAEARALQP